MVREFFRHGSNSFLAGGIALGAAAIASKKLPLRPASIASGAAIFFLCEYPLHRYVFHAKPSQNATMLAFQKRMHYDHHVDPTELELLFLPAWYLIPNLAFAAGLYALATRSAERTASIVFGNLLGLMYYEWVHYVAHVPIKPVTPIGRYLKKYHLWHHFKNEKMWFGVTNPAFDRMIGSYASVSDVAKSGTTKYLFAETSS